MDGPFYDGWDGGGGGADPLSILIFAVAFLVSLAYGGHSLLVLRDERRYLTATVGVWDVLAHDQTGNDFPRSPA